MVCVQVTVKATAGALGFSDTKETMRATLEIALLLLAGYFTLTDGVSELLHSSCTHNLKYIYLATRTHLYASSISKTTHCKHIHTSQCMYKYRIDAV